MPWVPLIPKGRFASVNMSGLNGGGAWTPSQKPRTYLKSANSSKYWLQILWSSEPYRYSRSAEGIADVKFEMLKRCCARGRLETSTYCGGGLSLKTFANECGVGVRAPPLRLGR